MKELKQRIALAAFTLFLSSSVNATIISTDWQTPGDNLITEDTVNGLQWLDLTVTAGTSYNDVVAQMGVGGTYEGWVYATNAHVTALLGEFGGNGIYTGTSHSHNIIFDSGLLDAWGTTNIGTTYTESFAITAQSFRTGFHEGQWFRDITDNSAGDIIDFNNFEWDDYDDHPILGSALIRPLTAPVPVPAAAWLFGSGLLGLFGVARRKVHG